MNIFTYVRQFRNKMNVNVNVQANMAGSRSRLLITKKFALI